MANDGASSDQEAERQLNPIACSHCRQRKRKCDRQLPHCLQCNNDPSNCHYPEQNKRGLPIGFINRLEARLAETEEALFRLVQSIDGSTNSHISLKPSSQRKDDRIQEWDNLPLKSMDDIRTWFQSRTDQPITPALQSGSMDLDHSGSPTLETPSDLTNAEFPDDAQSNLEDGVVLSDPVDDVSRSEIQSPRQSGSKAKEMEQRHPNMYF
ncbi:hypothetical protein BKA59DRAFT_484270 [Fusarium tricinctum]|uniref:Zn(2)-C6 fungal-type domain-containing protein n=1 Tax=Fusarium tricinctum TaxID=61284 RepID=A0A8K0RSW5_9HYPO|nr:hypothetical protein BKA59DRAFT_484270 [Fusarium tricinctum]